jgi:hypothetical protein
MVWDQVVAGSNPVAPTIFLSEIARFPRQNLPTQTYRLLLVLPNFTAIYRVLDTDLASVGFLGHRRLWCGTRGFGASTEIIFSRALLFVNGGSA